MTDKPNEPMLPCPFCGWKARMGDTEGGDKHISCTNPDCAVSILDDMKWGEEDYDATENVITKWNTRPASKMRQALEAMVSEKVDYMIRNNLGNPEKEHTIITSREALKGNE